MKLIKTPEQHVEALARIDELAPRFAKLTGDERNELEVLTVLVEKYERDHHDVPPPTPIEAIRFRMHQVGYKQKDLARILGGASRASEILSGKRQLSREMMRRLRDEWGIPADSLLGPTTDPEPDPPSPGRDPAAYPLKQMYDRGYFPGRAGDWKRDGKDKPGLLDRFFRLLEPDFGAVPVFNRQGGGAKAKINPNALEAWRLRVLDRARHETVPPEWRREELDGEFLRWLASLSSFDEGPRLAVEALLGKGLPVIIEARLDHTHLDGAALLGKDGRPVIGLTLRQNRLDNFWFTLFHEIGHVLRHLGGDRPAIFDSEIDSKRGGEIEGEADRFALEHLIPPEQWESVRQLRYAGEVRAAAKRLRVGPAVIAGRLRREANDYRIHRTLVGQGKARAALGFNDESWPK